MSIGIQGADLRRKACAYPRLGRRGAVCYLCWPSHRDTSLARSAEIIPAAWRAAIYAWAEGVPKFAAVWIYGSRARGDHHPGSDLDIAVEIKGHDHSERLAVWILEQRYWPELVLPALSDGAAPPEVHLEWYDPDAGMRYVGPGVEKDGICLWRRNS